LTRLGYEVIVANARRVRLISESSRKDDKLDATTLARLARIDPELLSPIRHRGEQAQADLMMIRARAVLVETRTALINAARGLTKSYGERLPSCATYQMGRDQAESLSPAIGAALDPLLAEVETVSERIREYDKQLEQLCQFGAWRRTNYHLPVNPTFRRYHFISIQSRRAFRVWRSAVSPPATTPTVNIAAIAGNTSANESMAAPKRNDVPGFPLFGMLDTRDKHCGVDPSNDRIGRS
jgi:hypothetical protein